jgi:hypothetical protein
MGETEMFMNAGIDSRLGSIGSDGSSMQKIYKKSVTRKKSDVIKYSNDIYTLCRAAAAKRHLYNSL